MSDKRPHDWLDKATFVAAALAAGFAGWVAVRTNDLASDSSKQLISATRAWVVPTGAKFDGKVTLGQNQRIKITFENVGKEAAWDVIHLGGQTPLFTVMIDAKQMPYIDVQTNPWPVNNLCDDNPLRYINRRTVYPSSKNEVISYVFNNPFVTQEFMNQKESFAFIGCFIYRTPIEPDKIRHSPYCFYFQPKRGGTVEDGTFEFCPSGSANAD